MDTVCLKAVIFEAAKSQESKMSEIVTSIFIVLDQDSSELKLTAFGAVAEVKVRACGSSALL